MTKELQVYQHLVAEKYNQYNELFLRLPFQNVPEAGMELPKFTQYCLEQLERGIAPDEIVDRYFSNTSEEEKFQTLFLFLQFVERQIVLFDALEDSAFALTHDLNGAGTLKNLLAQSDFGTIPNSYQTRIVLTAHPTQFYSSYILHLIRDLMIAIKTENLADLKLLLLQMSKTPFLRDEQPTPIDEAEFLMSYLTDIFYPVIKEIHQELYPRTQSHGPFIQIGFWPGADRDGNPNVTANVTLEVARTLKSNILKCYRNDIIKLSDRLTFKNVIAEIKNIDSKLEHYHSSDELLADLHAIKNIVMEQHNGLFIELIDELITAVTCFGFYFASLDLRQDSRTHSEFIGDIDIEAALQQPAKTVDLSDEVIATFATIPTIQKQNGPKALQRYIISNTQNANNVLEVMLLAHWAGLDIENLSFDIVPLFETINDLKHAPDIMEQLFSHPVYQKQLAQRNQQQTIMLGFSDGTKDGGYITANWSIYTAKRQLTNIAKKYGIDVIFFDGRGGPPARGGGNTRNFYRAQAKNIAQQQIQLTIQGQTISTNFGTLDSAKYNIEELLTAGLEKEMPPIPETLDPMMAQLSKISAEKYNQLKQHPDFLEYLEHVTPLLYYGELNIASRPPRRGKSGALTLEDLRAIPFVGAWSQMKQNVPGYYGVGTALSKLPEGELKQLYQDSLYFRTLIDNTMQSLKKTYFTLTQYLKHNEKHAAFWQLLFDEAELTKTMILNITETDELLSFDPVTKLSIELREKIVLPLQVIQQYALINANSGAEVYKKLILKSMATNINASRNSA